MIFNHCSHYYRSIWGF